ncbi:phosphate/phosphite/phosphonate ABC transporter substrate-binding protein [Roseomonas marmotae]|uniref:Phosphate/phosphite/phosphonate ABC transporter substrate-binding protein n=1 Tax=Roseomonas marmotae TaxID=2768161 RepID=A0ABS3KFX5_9PROT|nr:phosphate/phosphite/phosphonate ABC transporter substrate-binding protein [Roseomonas marmotae]MBO1075246.1 phosphate/phosphite/phosphonate ABC transporter substrate-binding protein [Roseomonas marmotae]QTI79650.1 phosphate/phosphite/phosphonate ABC transporter substrate-binding protein [Roseomonas marmotae]
MHRRHLLALTGLAAGLGASPGMAFRQARAQQPAMPAPGKRPWAAQVPGLRIGVLGGESESDRLGRYGDYARLLEETFQVPTRLYFASDYGGVQQAFAARQIEMASMAPAAYAGVWMDTNGGVEPILVTQEQDGSTAYVAVMYVRADSGISSLEQMRGRSIAWSDPNSASGYLIPRAELRAAGISPEPGQFFSRAGFGGGHDQALVAVLQKQYDAGVTWVSGQGEFPYTRGTLRAAVEKGMLEAKDLRVIWTSRPIQNGPIVVRADVPAEFKEDMIAFHLALPKVHPDIHRAVERGSAVGWARTSHKDYAVFVEMRQAEAQQRRRRD